MFPSYTVLLFLSLLPLRVTLFPYTTLFRSRVAQLGLVLLAERGQDDRLGKLRNDEPLAFERGPHRGIVEAGRVARSDYRDRKSTRLNSSHLGISYAVFCLKKKKA